MSKKLFIIVCGIALMAFGTSLCNYTGFGIDPFNALCIGSSIQFNISLGMFTLLAQIIIAVFVFCMNRRYIGIGSLIPMIVFGYLLEFLTIIVKTILPDTIPSILSIFLFGFGMMVIAFGMSLYMSSELGMVPYDGIAFVISEKTDKNPFLLRVILDIIVAIIAFIMGGPIQIGTIFIAFGIGPILNFMNRLTRRIKTDENSCYNRKSS